MDDSVLDAPPQVLVARTAPEAAPEAAAQVVPGPRPLETPSGVDARILAAALHLLKTRGSLAVTIEAVATSSGVAKTTIYRRYADREALLRAAVTAASTEVPVPRHLPTYETLRLLLEHAVETVEEIVGRGTVAAILLEEEPGLSPLLRDMVRARAGVLHDLMHERMDSGDLRPGLDAGLVGTVLVGAVFGQVVRGGTLDEAWVSEVLAFLWPAFTP